jgi:hypothetical protein
VSLAINSPRTAGRASNGKIACQNIVCIDEGSKRQTELDDRNKRTVLSCRRLRVPNAELNTWRQKEDRDFYICISYPSIASVYRTMRERVLKVVHSIT